MKTIGTITLKKRYEFTQYGEHAAWTDYVTCDPQTVALRYDGYWLLATFDGVLTRSTYPSGARQIGLKAQAWLQTQAWGMNVNLDLFEYEITNPDYIVAEMGTYSEGCGEKTGKHILALRPVNPPVKELQPA